MYCKNLIISYLRNYFLIFLNRIIKLCKQQISVLVNVIFLVNIANKCLKCLLPTSIITYKSRYTDLEINSNKFALIL